MSSIQFHSVFPENTLTEYAEFSQVDFLLTYEQRKLQLNTLRLCFDLEVTPGTGNLINVKSNPDLYFDNSVGFNGVVDSITTSMNGQVIENLTDYGRLCAMKTQTTKTQSELASAESSVEGKAATQGMTNKLLRGVASGEFTANADGTTTNYLTSLVEDPSAALKLGFCLNECFTMDGSAPLISFRKSGVVKVSLRLARNYSFLYGADATNASYKLKNIKLTYVSRMDDGTDTQIMARAKIGVKQSLASDLSNLSVIVPGRANAVSASFQPQALENSAVANNLQLHRVPELTQVQYLFNDSTNQFVTFIIKSEIESLERYIDSLASGGSNSASLPRLNANESYGVGTSLGAYVDLSRQKFNLQINSSIGATNVIYIAYLYFHALITL